MVNENNNGNSVNAEKNGNEDKIEVKIAEIKKVAEGTNTYSFERIDGGKLQNADAGSHIDLFLANGMIRQYSLTKAGDELSNYTVAIKRDRESRGGSVFIHDNFKVGETLKISNPRNNFPLNENADETVLIAGGIGITPIMAMIRRLEALGKSWKLYYANRTKSEAAFYDELSEFSQVKFHFDDESNGVLNIASIISSESDKASFYCCGPLPMLENFEENTKHLSPEQVNVEYFTAKEEVATEGEYTVELSQSGQIFSIEKGKTILQTLLDNGIEVDYGCEAGVCGTCETRLISGIPDHRDEVLTDAQKESNSLIMICCSGAKSEKLVLDI